MNSVKRKIYFFIFVFRSSSDRPREKVFKITNPNLSNNSLSPKAAMKKKVLKTNKGKESGTSSEEERWLDAIESGKLEEVNSNKLINFLHHLLNLAMF